MKQKATLIIPTHNRPEYLRRVLAYYEPLDFIAIIADSSTNPYKGNLPGNVVYQHTPDSDYTGKLLKALDKVNSPYVFLCADDDFILPNAIEEGIRFLDLHPDYSTFQGMYFSFEKHETWEFWPDYLSSIGVINDSDKLETRLSHFFLNYQQLHYSLHRKEIIQEVYQFFLTHPIKNGNLFELAGAMIFIANGKTYTSNSLYGVRESANRAVVSNGTLQKGLEVILKDESEKDDLDLFRKGLAGYIFQKYSIKEKDALEIIQNSFNSYIEFIRKPPFTSQLVYNNKLLNFFNIRLSKFLNWKQIEKCNKAIISPFYQKKYDFGYSYIYNLVRRSKMGRINKELKGISDFLNKYEKV